MVIINHVKEESTGVTGHATAFSSKQCYTGSFSGYLRTGTDSP